jgi:hypothetical protein
VRSADGSDGARPARRLTVARRLLRSPHEVDVKKVLLEILRLAWKVLRVYVWKWLAPYVGKLLFVGFVGVAAFTILILLLLQAC